LPTTIFTAIWIGGMVIGTLQYPHHPYIARPLLIIGSAYFVALSIVKMAKDSRDRKRIAEGA
jgi:hypothetical protein